jgi:site-specific DNA-methyltransferase (cytosine-N4-specific)
VTRNLTRVTPLVRAECLPLDDGEVQTTVTSPPYWGQRDYGYDGQSGMEECHFDYLKWWQDVATELHRVTAPSGTAWIVVGDTYNTRTAIRPSAHQAGLGHDTDSTRASFAEHAERGFTRYSARQPGYRDKDLMGLPWRMADIAMGVGWWVRCDVIWAKPWGSSENASDRPARSHEYVFLLARSQRGVKFRRTPYITANRSVWTIPPRHDKTGPAAFPDELVRVCLEATSDPDDIVLDPFAGSGTTVRVAAEMDRCGIGFDAAPVDLLDAWAGQESQPTESDGSPSERNEQS